MVPNRSGLLLFTIVLPSVWTGASASSAPSSSTKTVYDFDKLSSLNARLRVLEDVAAPTLLGFYEPSLRSFSIKPAHCDNTTIAAAPPPPQQRVCVTSTCYALLTATQSPGALYDAILSYEDREEEDAVASAGADSVDAEDEGAAPADSLSLDGTSHPTSNTIPVRQVLRTLLRSTWREDDLFQIPLVLYTILKVDVDRSLIRSEVRLNSQIATRIRTMLSVVTKAYPDPQNGPRQSYSAYITYQVCKVLALLQESTSVPPGNGNLGGLPSRAIPDDFWPLVQEALTQCAEVSFNDLCRMLAYRYAQDVDSFDVVRLAYSLLTYIKSTELLQAAGSIVVAGGHELSEATPPPTIKPLNQRLVATALEVFFQEQNSNGLWRKGQPIYKNLRLQGRKLENAFVFSVNTLGSLLCTLPPETFRPYLTELERTLTWIESHQLLKVIPDYMDAETGECYGKPLQGWCAPHYSDDVTAPQAWPTAQVLKYNSWMRKTISQLMHDDVLAEFGGVAYSKKDGRQASSSWARLFDCDLGDPVDGEEPCRTLKSVLEERFVQPFASSIDNPSYGAAYSAILFGPPGTGKTTICEALAERMGWDFLVIDTAAFLADGLSNVAARIRYVFTRLMALNECIILFDEIEEFALDRESPGLSMESRMLTTAMLTAINDLRRTKRSVFLVATNRLRAFDSAITRQGRFDLQLFVGTPNLESRVVQFQQRLAGIAINETAKKQAIESYKTFLKSVWKQDTMFMNYLEGVQFASACASIVASRQPLGVPEMEAILKKQVAVMTVRGSARNEYMASMELSRL